MLTQTIEAPKKRNRSVRIASANLISTAASERRAERPCVSSNEWMGQADWANEQIDLV